MSEALVIGYGNDLRGDDAVGLRVAEAVAAWNLPGVRVLAVHQLTPELVEELETARLAVFVDASTGAERVEVRSLTPEARVSGLGHTSDPAVLLSMTEALYGRCPRAWLVEVPARGFEFGAELSRSAAEGVSAALGEIMGLLHEDVGEVS